MFALTVDGAAALCYNNIFNYFSSYRFINKTDLKT